MKNKGFAIIAPASVMIFVVILVVMYTLVDKAPLVSGKGFNAPVRAAQVNDSLNQPVMQARSAGFLNRQPPASLNAEQAAVQIAPGSVYLGLMLMDVTTLNSINQPKGVYVTRVVQGSPADKAGVQKGDRLIEFDHQAIKLHQQVGDILSAKAPGDTVKLLLQRGIYKKSYYIKLAKRPAGTMQGTAGSNIYNTGAYP